jgi:hypothetical protein
MRSRGAKESVFTLMKLTEALTYPEGAGAGTGTGVLLWGASSYTVVVAVTVTWTVVAASTVVVRGQM